MLDMRCIVSIYPEQGLCWLGGLGKGCWCSLEFTLEGERQVRALVFSVSAHSGEECKELENSKCKLTFLWLMTICSSREKDHILLSSLLNGRRLNI